MFDTTVQLMKNHAFAVTVDIDVERGKKVIDLYKTKKKFAV